MILDTTFLIDFHRETTRRAPGAAAAWLSRAAAQPVHISVVTMGEFMEGLLPHQSAAGRAFMERFRVFPVDQPVALAYAGISRAMRAAGERIGDNDLWIAATALAHDLPLVTRDIGHFRRIEPLRLLSY